MILLSWGRRYERPFTSTFFCRLPKTATSTQTTSPGGVLCSSPRAVLAHSCLTGSIVATDPPRLEGCTDASRIKKLLACAPQGACVVAEQ